MNVLPFLQMTLSQKRYKGGLFFGTAITNGEIESLDFRFFRTAEGGFSPTRSGFRISQDDLANFHKLVNQDDLPIDPFSIWEHQHRKLVAQYRDDEYGQAVDFRYYISTTKYTGWEKRGIRLALSDFQKWKEIMKNCVWLNGVKGAVLDLKFNVISPKHEGAKGTSSTSSQALEINPLLQTFLNDQVT